MVDVTDHIFDRITVIIITVAVIMAISLTIGIITVYRKRDIATVSVANRTVSDNVVPGGSYEETEPFQTTKINEYER